MFVLLVQVVQLFDSWAHHLSPAQFMEFSLPYANRVVEGVRARHPDVPIMFHANGGTGKLELIGGGGTNADVIGLDWHTQMSTARSIIGPDSVIQVGDWLSCMAEGSLLNISRSPPPLLPPQMLLCGHTRHTW